ncbi:neo-calmodulin isoform X2 [Eurytemora carolleeae]|uniref:neo-calmodulin isoform X2 n=1 Tax=Eurytemora carolleeae TaxID=1294199 RepID=UPI000C775C7C|nr:neo-calmodulin isoform X2 [Eurytemora carolleeae]|eukprot:XP_023323418.1 neo-calmodulin-like isoform X2 [Eurytemora affinis]
MEDDQEEQDRDTVGKMMIETLHADTLKEYQDIFSFFDRDGGGSITVLELGQVMRTFGWDPTDAELRDMINVVDQDGNGQITFNEFVWLMTREFHDTELEEEIREAFRVFDKDGHGFVTSQEMATVLQSIGDPLSPEETEELIDEADIDGDGNINYEEFITILFKSQKGLKKN